MLSQYNLVVSLINQTTTSSVKEAEAQLNNLHKQNDIEFFTSLYHILKDSNQQQKIQNSAALYISSAISDNITQLSSEQLLKFLINVLADREVSPSLKRLLERGIINLLQRLQHCKNNLTKQLTCNLTGDEFLRDTGSFLIACFAFAEEVSVDHIINLASRLFQITLTRIFTESIESLQNAREYNEIIKTWIIVANRLLKLFEPKDKKKNSESLKMQFPQAIKVLYSMADSQALCSVILSLYKWISCPQLFLCTQKDQCQINILKGQAAELQVVLTSFSCKNNYQTEIYKFGLNNLNKIIQNLVIVATNKRAIQQYECQDLILNFVTITKILFNSAPSLFAKIWKNILFSLVFPLISVDSQELEQFQDDADHFLSLSEDCCEKQKFGILKTEVISLLETMCDKSERMDPQECCIDFVIRFSVDSWKVALGVNVERNWEIKPLQMQIAILILSVFSFRIQSHQKELEDIKFILSQQNLRELMPPLQCSRLYLFLGYNYIQLFRNPNEGEHWIATALAENSHQTTVRCALDFLSNLASEYYSDFFFQKISQKIITNEYGLMWDLLEQLIQVHYLSISQELMIRVVNRCFEKIQMEMKNTVEEEVKRTLVISKIINVFQAILDLEDYTVDKPQLKQALWRVTQGFPFFASLGMASEVLKIILTFLRNISALNEYFYKVLPVILENFAKDSYEDREYYSVINEYIMKTKGEPIELIMKNLKNALMFHVYDMGGPNKKVKNKILIGNLFILLQNLLAMHGNSLEQEQLWNVMTISMSFMPNEKQTEYEKIIVARVLLTRLLCSIYFSQPNREQFLNTLLMISKYSNEKVFYSYDLKVLICCLRQQLFKENELESIVYMLQIMATGIKYHKERAEQEKVVKMLRKKQKTNVKHIKMNRNVPYETLLKFINTPFQIANMDDEVKGILQMMKQKNLNFYVKVIEQLDQETQNTFIKICNEKILGTGEKRVITKIVGIKKPEEKEPIDDFDLMCEQKMLQNQKQKEDEMQSSQQKDQDDDQDLGFKRKRVIEKKKAKKNKKNGTKNQQ